ncbi:hypothetical protein ACOJBZ_16800 [Enterococcus innesii]|uniref:hypothetical protein n=1 Tax=Enterococcus innesii TaxID=2839759 RepID=UPI003B5B27E1
MKKTIAVITTGTLLITALGFATEVNAEQTITNDTEAQIRVRGSIGEFDSTTPGPDPEDINKWINVTLPTTAIFYSTSVDKTQLSSPEYSIINNSARGVSVNVAGIEQAKDIDIIDSLKIGEIEFITNGEVSLEEESTLFTLKDNQSDNSADRIGVFKFSGEASGASSSEEVNPHFNVVFKFIPGAE